MRFLKDPVARFQWLVSLLVAIIIGPIGLCIYWATDHELPIMGRSGVFVGWDGNNPRIGWVEWTGIRQRFCEGTSYRWLVDGVVIELTPIHVGYNGDFNNPEREMISWTETFEVPEWFHNNGSYRVRVEYSCNAWQRLFPLIVNLPDVKFRRPESENFPHSHPLQNSIP